MAGQLSVVVEEDRDRAMLIVGSLRAAGDFILVISELTSLASQVQPVAPTLWSSTRRARGATSSRR